MPGRGPCPPGKYITHPAECARAAVELGMKYLSEYEYDEYYEYDHARRGCNYNGNAEILRGTAFFNPFVEFFHFYFLIGQVWWTFLFLFFIGQVGWTTGRRRR